MTRKNFRTPPPERSTNTSRWLLPVLAGAILAGPSVVRAQGNPAPAPVQATAPPTPDPALPPLPDDLSPAVRAYLEALQQQVRELQRKLNQVTEGRQKQNGPASTPSDTPPGSIPSVGGPKALPPVPSARTLTGPLASRLQIGGYAELRLTNIGNGVGDRIGPHDNAEFQLNRFRPRLTYFIDPHWQADLQLNAVSRSPTAASIDVRDAYIEYHNGRNNLYALRLGQAKMPFGFETFVEGDENRPALERASYHETLAPSQRDLGLTAIWNPRQLPVLQAYLRGPLVAVGVYNGNGVNRQDNDQSKTVVAQGRMALNRHLTLGLSGMSGTFTPTVGRTNVREAANLDLESYFGRFRTQTELMLGRNLGHDVNGGLAQLEYQSGVPGSFFVRYDWYDPNVSAGGDYWKRYTLGWYKDFTRNIRLTAEYDFVFNQLTRNRRPNTFGLELQANL